MFSHAEALPGRYCRLLRGLPFLALSLVYALSLPLILYFRLGAEGPVAVLTIWISLFLGGFYAGRVFPRLGRYFRLGSTVIAALGVGLVLLQLNVARRSLAEAWLELVRAGRAFGFFSFFAAELAALFSTLSACFVLSRGLLPGTIALAASASLIHGILYASPWTLCLGALLGLPTLVYAGGAEQGHSGRALLYRTRRMLAPVIAAALLSLPFAFLPSLAGGGALLRVVDLTPLVLRAAPALPLLLDVPGYGYGVGASRLESSVYLTDAPLFSARGVPGETLYLGYAVFREWTGSGWLEVPSGGRELPLLEGGASAAGEAAGARRLTLSLEADLYDRIPLPPRTVAARLPADHPGLESADELRGLRFKSGVVRGFSAELYYGGPEGGARRADPDEAEAFGDPGQDPDGRFRALGESLVAEAGGPNAPDGSRAEAILRFLGKDFRYSLRTSSGGGESAMERFLFQDRRGYCLYFAGAAVILARHAGIPARLVEGFRLSLDGEGRGLVRGVDSHAWAEFLLDGSWVTVEATPPFASEDPFRFIEAGDRVSRRQLAAIFGSPEPSGPGGDADGRPGAGLHSLRPLIAAAAIAAALIPAILVLRLLDRGYRLRRRAARLVRRGRRRGIPGPEVLGWTVWAERMAGCEARSVAADLLRATFDPGARSARPQRPSVPMSRR